MFITKLSFPFPNFLSPHLRNPKLRLAVTSISLRRTPPPMPPSSSSLIAEYAKSNRSACKTCTKNIEAKTLRIGVVTKDKAKGFDMTKWHHFHCLSFNSLSVDSAESISGFDSLKSDDQEALKKIVDERVEVKDAVEPSEKVVAEKKQSSNRKKKIKDRDGDVDSVEKEPKKMQLSVSDDAENEIALEVSDIKDMYKSSSSLIAEYAKSNRSACKTCTKNIEAKTLRIGVVTKDKAKGFDMTKWHHFHCLSFNSLSVDSAESISGFDSLNSDDQEALKKIVDERVEVKDAVEPSEKVVAEKKQSSNRKKKIKDRDGDVDSVEKEPKKMQLSVSDDAEIEIAHEVSDIKDMYKSSSSLIAEYAKSNRSACKTCTKNIEAKTLRIGVLTKDKAKGFDMTKWHHFHCLSFNSLSVDSAESISGFDSLKSDDQEALKKIVDERVEVKDAGEQSEKVVAEKKQSSNRKKKIKDRDGDVDSVEKEPKKMQLSVSDDAENEIALEVSDIKDMYKSSSSLIAEYAKSNRSACKTCTKNIEAKTLRIGVVTKDKAKGFDMTKWHHFHCLSFNSLSVDSAESISGFDSLNSDDQEALKKIVDERVEGKDAGEQSEKVVAEKKQSSNRKNKIKDRDGDVDSVEKEPKKMQLSASDDAEIEIALEVSDIKDMYKDATLQPKWRAFHSIIFLEKDDGLHDSSKIAAFDFDGCLANTNVKITGADSWSLMYPTIPDKLRKLYDDGFKLVIFTNESNINRWTKKRQKAVDSKVGRLNNFIKHVNLPMQVFIACGFDTTGRKDAYRKPQPGMWRVMEKYFNSGIAIDMDHSFYVGDAAGREKDHSDADIKFAQAIGLKFYLPEEYFDAKD